jgi:hypothetical protein
MVLHEQVKPLIKRAPTIADVTSRILRFDTDNLYPQRMESIYQRSSTLKGVLDRVADFVNGEGFVDQNIAGMIVNRRGLKGQSLNKVLGIVSRPWVKWQTVPMHVGYNLLGQICELNPIKFERIRFGLRNEHSCITHYAYSANWEKDGRSANDQNIRFYHRFNPDPQIVLAQIDEAGGIDNYRGQILYLTPEEDEYPLATFDVVSNDAQVQDEISQFKLGNTQNSFLATLAILFPGEFGSRQEEQDFKDIIANKTGGRNAGSRIGLQDKTGTRKASDIFQPLTPENLDKLFEFTETSVKENIMESEAFPSILMGKSQSGLLAQNDMEEAYTYVNSITRNRRLQLSEVFSIILSYWEFGVITDAAIIEQRYILNSSTGTGGVDINDNLRSMSGIQSINFARILRKYEQRKYNRVTAETMLRGGFGLSDEEITKLLDAVDAAAAEDGASPESKQAAYVALAKQYL